MVVVVQQERDRQRARLGLCTESIGVDAPSHIDDEWLKNSVAYAYDYDKKRFEATATGVELLDDGEGKRFRVGGEVTTEDVQQQQKRQRKSRRRGHKGNSSGSGPMVVDGMQQSRLTTFDRALGINISTWRWQSMTLKIRLSCAEFLPEGDAHEAKSRCAK